MRGVLTVAEMQLRELGRRRVAVTLLVALPLLTYLSIPAGEWWGLGPGAVGLAWSIGGAAMFSALGWRRVDSRLSLAGLHPWVQVCGRALTIAAFGVVLMLLALPLLLRRSDPPEPTALLVALGLTVLVGVPLGLAIGTALPHEMEAMLVLIGVGAVSMSLPPDLAGAQAAPLWGPSRLVVTAGLADHGSFAGPVLHTLLTAAVLTIVTWVCWRTRVRINPALAPPATPADDTAHLPATSH